MKITIISQIDYKTSNWSGGETTEVFLFPPNGDYALKKFDYRISTAVVNLSESDFTPLPGFNRLIMSLDNPLELHHDNGESVSEVRLKPFEVHSFSGSDKTKSFGKCQDFNLIYSDKLQGEMSIKNNRTHANINAGVTYIYYALKQVVVELLGQSYQLNKGESLIVSEIEKEESVFIDSDYEGVMPSVIEVSVH